MSFIGPATGTGVSQAITAHNKWAWRYQAGGSFTAKVMAIATGSGFNSGEYVRLGIYADDSGEPGDLLGYSNEIEGADTTAFTWYFATLVADVNIVENNYYWLAVITDSSLSVSTTNYSLPERTNADSYSDGFADPFGSATGGNDPAGYIIASDVYPIDGELVYGGAVLESSAGTKLCLVTDFSNNYLYLYSDIDTLAPTLEDSDSALTIFGQVSYIEGLHAAIDTNDNIHMVAAANTAVPTRDIAYCIATYSAGSWTFGSWELVESYTQTPDIPGVWISLDSNSKPHVVFVDNVKQGGVSKDNVFYIEKTGASWANLTQMGVRSDKNDGYCYPYITLKGSNYIEVDYYGLDASASEHHATYRIYTTSWSGETYYQMGTIVNYYDFRSIITTSDTAYRYHTYNQTSIKENDVATGYSTDTVYNKDSPVLVDDSDRYVIYIDSDNVIHVISNTGSGWVDEGKQQYGDYGNVAAQWSYNFNNQSGEINYICTNSGNTLVFFHSFSLAVPASLILPAPARRLLHLLTR